MWDGHLAWLNIENHRIELPKSNTAPVHSARNHVGAETGDSEKAKIDKMHAENIIEPIQNEWTASIVFVLNKDETLWFCVDYCKLNDVTKRNSWLITHTDD